MLRGPRLSASALVPFMSDLKPPSQNKPGPSPGSRPDRECPRRRTGFLNLRNSGKNRHEWSRRCGRDGIAGQNASRRGDGVKTVRLRVVPRAAVRLVFRRKPRRSASGRSDIRRIEPRRRPRARAGCPARPCCRSCPRWTRRRPPRAAVDTRGRAAALRRARRSSPAEDGPLEQRTAGARRRVGAAGHRRRSNPLQPAAATPARIAELIAPSASTSCTRSASAPSRSAAALTKKRAAFAGAQLRGAPTPMRGSATSPMSRALAAGDRVIAPSDYAADQIIDPPSDRAREARRHSARASTRSRFDPPRDQPGARRGAAARLEDRGAASASSWCRDASIPPRASSCWSKPRACSSNGGLRGVMFVLAGDDRQHFDYARRIAAQARRRTVSRTLIRQVGHCPDMPAAYWRRISSRAADRAAALRAQPPPKRWRWRVR